MTYKLGLGSVRSGLKWTVQKTQSGRSRKQKADDPKGEKLDGLKLGNWTVIRDENKRSKKIEELNRFSWRKLVIKCVDDKFAMFVTSQVTN